MRMVVCFIFLSILLNACQGVTTRSSDQMSEDSSYDRFKGYLADDSMSPAAHADAEFIATYHYDPDKRKEAKEWLKKYDAFSTANKQAVAKMDAQDSAKLAGLGKIELLKMDDQQTKCNLKKAYYLIINKEIDSSDLAFVSKNFATRLFHEVIKDNSCSYPVMSAAYFYVDKKQYIDGIGPIAGCTITPDDYSGYVFVDEWSLSKYQHGKSSKN